MLVSFYLASYFWYIFQFSQPYVNHYIWEKYINHVILLYYTMLRSSPNLRLASISSEQCLPPLPFYFLLSAGRPCQCPFGHCNLPFVYTYFDVPALTSFVSSCPSLVAYFWAYWLDLFMEIEWLLVTKCMFFLPLIFVIILF